MNENFLTSTRKLFLYYKSLGDKAIAQVNDQQINWRPNEVSNSIALIVPHLSGNMISRFTDFLTSDGEKPWRNREEEFEKAFSTKSEMLVAWENGWRVLLDALANLKGPDLDKVVFIRNEGHTVLDALQRQLAHYPHHVGQIVYLAKMLKEREWQSLSIPKGESASYNAEKFSEDKGMRHFTDKA
ncbi:DUF1572 family protein [Pseudochryseolinea flava]|uniref:DUF1572 domain-containing protein n=1 Tax=Pseudochryseolinea flava TaxID=2059302 RepID=A0A364Y7U8_9BACT|nr:DUF1572 family protein [Pseudochryseolinea flava]RAW03194.1 hypothetical protein DQQ10_03645 [Pseudochryseolinea flava]